jgi:hypothetical protein
MEKQNKNTTIPKFFYLIVPVIIRRKYKATQKIDQKLRITKEFFVCLNTVLYIFKIVPAIRLKTKSMY